jgi:hypothetical protein
MDKEEIFLRVTEGYKGYYDITFEGCLSPFDATGFLSNEARQYFLVKAAHIASVNSYEYVYFKVCDCLNASLLSDLDRIAWEDGISRVKPDTDHKNTDVALIIICDIAKDDVKENIGSYKHSKNYMLGLHGFSNYRLVVIEASTDLIFTNRRGKDLTDFVTQIKNVGKGE